MTHGWMPTFEQQPGLEKDLGLTFLPLISGRVSAIIQSSLLFRLWAVGLALRTPRSLLGLPMRPTAKVEGSQVERNCSSQSSQLLQEGSGTA